MKTKYLELGFRPSEAPRERQPRRSSDALPPGGPGHPVSIHSGHEWRGPP
jgi:hypothetical protein